MQTHPMRSFRHAMAAVFFMAAMLAAGFSHAAPYAAMVMDARNGEVIFARNHDTKLHPASLTKMMTLYVTFEAIKHGEITLDTQFTVSRGATQTTCVCLGLRPGQKISVRYLIRAAALRSANDAAVVLAEGVSGSVEAFAERMTRTARAMGMENTTFRNPHGLTQPGHLSTARDMTILGRQLYFDYPQYYNIFSRRSDFAGVGNVPNTNRRFLDAYSGADGIKTGYTRAAGFNLTASAKRGGKHIISTMFGGSSTAARNAHVAELMDIGFSRAATRVASVAPRTPAYQGRGAVAVAQAPTRNGDDDPSAAAKTIRLQTAVRTSPRPAPRAVQAPDDAILLAVRESVDAVVSDIAGIAEAVAAEVGETEVAALAPEALIVTPPPRPERAESETPADVSLDAAIAAGFTIADPDDVAELDSFDGPTHDESSAVAADSTAPAMDMLLAEVVDTEAAEIDTNEGDTTPVQSAQAPVEMAEFTDESDVTWIGASESMLAEAVADDALILSAEEQVQLASLDQGAGRPDTSGIILTSTPRTQSHDASPQALAAAVEAHLDAATSGGPEIVTRLSTSDGGRLWGVSLGQFNSRSAAERGLITVKMAEAAALGNGVSRIRQTSGRFEASVAGLTQSEAERACLRLSARSMDCSIAHP
ncbi:D-alanyl-D-alanine carboxypeptidase [Roseinatronobacter thiooxidans]|uniref:D-alanyl-D-alanine carboxypeptidase n=2 Tax=Roseinatronobacter thiooxidans TaxID=121821 RepID=A0A2W7RVV3_9RHOB|nr:D-alanyl-D-alanine carboxypeptidase [Roseinatronobacter thiooxidans]